MNEPILYGGRIGIAVAIEEHDNKRLNEFLSLIACKHLYILKFKPMRELKDDHWMNNLYKQWAEITRDDFCCRSSLVNCDIHTLMQYGFTFVITALD